LLRSGRGFGVADGVKEREGKKIARKRNNYLKIGREEPRKRFRGGKIWKGKRVGSDD